MKEDFERMAELAWKVADKMMDEGMERFGYAWTAIAQLLDELSGRKDWGILEVLKDADSV